MSGRILWATLRKNVLVQTRAYPMAFFVGNVMTGFYTALGAWLSYYVLFGGNLDQRFYRYAGTENYMSFVILGSLCYLFVVRTCLNVSRSLISELREGTLQSLLLAPFRRAEYFAGNMLVQTVTSSIEAGVSLIVGFMFGLRISSFHLPSFLLVVLVGLYSFFGLSMVLGCVMLYTRDTYISQNTLFVFMMLVCGVSFPVEFLPWGLRVFSYAIPLTGVNQMLRGVLLSGEKVPDFYQTLLWVFGVGSVYIALGFALMRTAEIIALEKMEG